MITALLLVLAAAPTPQTYQFQTDGTPQVHISNIEGSVSVEGSDGNNVYFEVFQERDNNSRTAYPVEVVQDGDVIRARVCCGECGQERKNSRSCNNPAATRFVVKVPRGTELHVSSVNAAVKVAGVGGAQEISSVNGRVDVAGSKQALNVSAVSGEVALAPEQVARTSVSTVSGDVRLKLPERADAQLGFSSVSGSFNGKSVSLGSVEKTWGKGTHDIGVSTVSGSLEVAATN
jgi:hypothetical protein